MISGTNKVVRVAILDMYEGFENQGMRRRRERVVDRDAVRAGEVDLPDVVRDRVAERIDRS